MRQLCLVTILWHMLVSLQAQVSYDVSQIPDSLKEGANVVKRMEDVVVQIKDKGKAVIIHRYALTVLNEAGNDLAVFAQPYSKLISVKSIDGTLYDASGRKIRSLKKSEVRDISDTDENSLADDSRAKIHDFSFRFYPYTVEYEYTMTLDGIFYLYEWVPVNTRHVAVQQSRMQVYYPQDYELRFKSFNLPAGPEKKVQSKNQFDQWEISNYPAVKYEKFMGAWHEVTPQVMLAPADFEFQGYSGQMRNWNEFGKFIYQLNAGRDVLPDKVRQQVHQLTDGLKDPREKLRVLYEYLQKSTRYISIQLGLGGWQTFDAKYVAGNGYGDCKALTNYLYSMLKEAGIKSYYTLIHAGQQSDDIVYDFPSNQFNHIILCALTGSDTTWVECTSPTLPSGYLGNFTSNRHALLVDEEGGKLVTTPVYHADDNLQVRKIRGTLDKDGRLLANIEAIYRAEQYDYMERMLRITAKDKQLEQLKEMLPLSNFDASEIAYKEVRGKLPEIQESLKLSIADYASHTGKRIFINPNILSRSSQKLNEKERRLHRIHLRLAYTDIDSVDISLPPGYTIENLPKNQDIQSDFGSYQASFSVKDGTLMYRRKLIRLTGEFPAGQFTRLAEFLNAVYQADRESVVLLKE